jgi:hypothetical protein
VKALVDSGSPRTIFPRGVGDLLGIEFPIGGSTKRIVLLGDRRRAITSTVHLTIPQFPQLAWEAEVDFLYDEIVAFGILGYESFLNRWAVTFNGGLGYFVVEPAESYDARQPPDMFDDLDDRWSP